MARAGYAFRQYDATRERSLHRSARNRRDNKLYAAVVRQLAATALMPATIFVAAPAHQPLRAEQQRYMPRHAAASLAGIVSGRRGRYAALPPR